MYTTRGFRGGQGRGKGACGTTEVLVRAVQTWGMLPQKKCICYNQTEIFSPPNSQLSYPLVWSIWWDFVMAKHKRMFRRLLIVHIVWRLLRINLLMCWQDTNLLLLSFPSRPFSLPLFLSSLLFFPSVFLFPVSLLVSPCLSPLSLAQDVLKFSTTLKPWLDSAMKGLPDTLREAKQNGVLY